MITNAQTLTPKPALPPVPGAAATAPAAAPAGGPSFAQFLTEQSSTPPPPAGTEAHDDAPAEVDGEAAKATAKQAAARRAGQVPQRQAVGQRAADPAPQPAAPKAELRPDADMEATPAEDAEPAELKEFTQLIGLAPPAAPAPAPMDAAAKVEVTAEVAAPAGLRSPAERRAGPAAKEEPATVDAADVGRGRPAEPRTEVKTGARSAAPAIAADSQPAKETPSAAPASAAAPSFAATLAQAQPAPVVRSDATPGALPTAAVQAPLHSPAFAPEVGARVSLLAVDGVQRAELQLNPAEMGPVTVQIVLDGNQAQVSFQAQQAETRQALEQSLPELAAALQGQGLTLSGGGVFQQAPRDDHPADGSQARPDAQGQAGEAAGRVTDVTAAMPQRQTVGLLDAFA